MLHLSARVCNGNVLSHLPDIEQSQVLFAPFPFPARFFGAGHERSSPFAARMETEVLDYFCSALLLSGGLSNGPSLLSAEAVVLHYSPEAGLGYQQPIKGISSEYFVKCALLQSNFLFTNCKLWVFISFQLNSF